MPGSLTCSPYLVLPLTWQIVMVEKKSTLREFSPSRHQSETEPTTQPIRDSATGQPALVHQIQFPSKDLPQDAPPTNNHLET
jgi:hypothetical protein